MQFKYALKRIGAAVALLGVATISGAAHGQTLNWSGFYLGGGAGGRWGEADWSTSSIYAPVAFPVGAFYTPLVNRDATLSSTSFRGAVHAGYNWQVANWVWGVEADLGVARSKATIVGTPGVNYFTNIPGDRFSAELGLDGSIRARGGALLAPSVLLYATGGLALQQAKLQSSCGPQSSATFCNFGTGLGALSESATKTLTGWTLGGGVEAMLSRNWLVRSEYRYSDFGTLEHRFFSGNPQLQWTGAAPVRTHILNFGLSYKL